MTKKLTYEFVKDYIESFGYSLLSDGYQRAHTKLEISCSQGHSFFASWIYFNRGKRCPECSLKKDTYRKRFTFGEVKEYVESFGEILLSTEYKGSNFKIQILCKKGHSYFVSWGNFLNCNTRCSECAYEKDSNRKRLSFEYIKEFIEKRGYFLISKTYIGSNKKLRLSCKEHGIFIATFNDVQQGTRCPNCSRSRGEDVVAKCLNEIGIVFESEKRFEGCKNARRLPFDFFLPDLNTLIEYQGRQHYEVVEHFGGARGFESRQKHDKIKRDFCHKNNIYLLEIPHGDFNDIEEILIKELL